MGFLNPYNKTLAVIMSILVFATPLLSQEASSDFLQGMADGKKDSKGSSVWFIAGLGCGAIGFVIAAVHNPNVPAENVVGKSQEYVLGYTEGYQSEARRSNMLFAGFGWAISAAVVIAIMVSSE